MKQSIVIASIGVVGLLVSGCAATVQSGKKEGELKTQVAALETRVNELNQRVEELSPKQETIEPQGQGRQTARMENTSAHQKANAKAGGILSTKQIQLALKTAGYYNGTVDGKAGPQTKEALKAFQRANGLTPDGVAGTKTAAALTKHLSSDSGAQQQ